MGYRFHNMDFKLFNRYSKLYFKHKFIRGKKFFMYNYVNDYM